VWRLRVVIVEPAHELREHYGNSLSLVYSTPPAAAPASSASSPDPAFGHGHLSQLRVQGRDERSRAGLGWHRRLDCRDVEHHQLVAMTFSCSRCVTATMVTVPFSSSSAVAMRAPSRRRDRCRLVERRTAGLRSRARQGPVAVSGLPTGRRPAPSVDDRPQRQRADEVTPRATQRLGHVPLRWRGVDSDGKEVTQRSWHDERVGADIGRAREQSFAARLERHPTFGRSRRIVPPGSAARDPGTSGIGKTTLLLLLTGAESLPRGNDPPARARRWVPARGEPPTMLASSGPMSAPTRSCVPRERWSVTPCPSESTPAIGAGRGRGAASARV